MSRRTGVARSTLRSWVDSADCPATASACPRCDNSPVPSRYPMLLGFYLGDGCLSTAARYQSLRISCDARMPGIIDDLSRSIAALNPGRPVFHVKAPGVVVVQSHWKHWTCLFPQHGPGRKHDRLIALEQRQRELVVAHPAAFLRGLFHSDGCRVRNWATRPVGGVLKRYDYPRWQFTNHSIDIQELCCWALDLVDIAWRRSNHWTISVSTRAGVARLDELIGLKS